MEATDAPQNEGTHIPGEAGPNVDVETRARRMGWTPKDDFKGNPDRWIDADAFVARAENELPLARAQIRRLESTIDSLSRDVRDMVRNQGRVAAQAYQRALDDIERQKLAAVETGNVQAYQQLQQQAASVQREMQQAVPPQRGNQPPQEVLDWVAENPWFNSDPELHHMAIAMETVEGTKTPGASPRAVLERVKAEMQRRYPEKFGNAARTAPAAVEGVPEARGASRGGKKGYGDLPAEAKAACDKFVKQGLFKTKDDYVKEYFSDER